MISNSHAAQHSSKGKPLQEPYKKYEEIEPGIVQVMNSKFIDRISYKFRDLPLPKFAGKQLKSHRVLYLKTNADIGNESLINLE